MAPDVGTGVVQRPAGLSIRIKLTLSYAGFLLVAGVAMFVVGFLILRFVPEGNLLQLDGGSAPNRGDLLAVFLRYAWWALGLLLVFGLAGGWFLAGRVLRPLSRITDAARLARDGSLRHRVHLPGRRDELTDLADAFDDMMARVEGTIDEQRRFAANASHELRTPLATVRTMLEVARADPDGRDVDLLLDRLATMNERSIALTEALLTLSRAEHGTLERIPVDLAGIVEDALLASRADAAAAGVRIHADLAPAPLAGNATLLAQLTTNLIRNALVHNLAGNGAAAVQVRRAEGTVRLTVSNTGAPLDPALVATLPEPFVRGAGRTRRLPDRDGAGLGLAIVASIVRAHAGTLLLTARPEGGLRVDVTLPVDYR
ncbi:sensor histidine kinase [Microbacterium caowuchunii]|uniref:histidine kinase n=1 Tax=Microbacterium caowuchunii TaxID=2614638 RepID=A0A5N0TNQ8_9MICO|nr:HAMP domain-containing sensor histidine kinase [Microbacterium caowuchunii]KAA9135837.1 HAMP domain-containing histidine kinase [Microbacterium caowuchunii]